jgi:hypothetical protein
MLAVFDLGLGKRSLVVDAPIYRPQSFVNVTTV